MISSYAKKFCKDDITNIENYDKAINDNTQIWHCHHRLETHKYKDRNRKDWTKRDEFIPASELKALGLYYNRPAAELIFLTSSDHISLHHKCVSHSEIHNRNISKGMIGHKVSDECKRKMSEARKRYWINHYNHRSHSEQTRHKMSESQQARRLREKQLRERLNHYDKL